MLKIIARDDDFHIYSMIPIQANNDSRHKVAEYLSRANYGLINGNFEIDFRDGEIRFKTYQYCGARVPTEDTVYIAMAVSMRMLERYGDGLVKVMFDIQTPEEAIKEAEADVKRVPATEVDEG